MTDCYDSLPTDTRADAPFDVDSALYFGNGESGVYVQLAARLDGSGYVLHMVYDHEHASGGVYVDDIRRDTDAKRLREMVTDSCYMASDIVADWQQRRPGVSRIGPSVRRHVRDAMRDLEDNATETEAAIEGSGEYFDRYIAGDR
jgi:hypothetical protein